MTQSEYVHRGCPTCGASDAAVEVHSDRRGEAMGFDEVRPFWSGLFKEKVFFSYARCNGCGLLFTPTFFSDDQLGQLYADMAPNMDLVTSDAIAATQKKYFLEAAAVAGKRGSYLEIGPDTGHIVRHAAADGRFDHYWLFEPNRSVHAELGAATGGASSTISEAMTDLSAVPDRSVALALMVHVLDHLLDPVDMLRQIHTKLTDDGALVVVTHNEASLLRKVMGTRWPPFCLQHPEVYNPVSIKAMFSRAGFARIDVDRSMNYFPIDFMVKQAAWTAGIKVDKLPLPKTAIGLKLGNIMTVARR